MIGATAIAAGLFVVALVTDDLRAVRGIAADPAYESIAS